MMLMLLLILAMATFILISLSDSAAPHIPNLPNPPLKDLAAAHGIQLGNFADLKHIDQPADAAILSSQYSFATIDGEPNWTYIDGSLRPTSSTYNYTNIDKVMAFAESHNMPVQMHHLVWGEKHWLPKWLTKGNYSKTQLLSIIHDHITNVAGHYKGQVQVWSVVNEAFSRKFHAYGLHDWWADHIGDTSYIDDSFIWAHQTDPNAKLILNDYNNESQNNISNAEYKYVKGALARGIPIQGIGMQMHIHADYPPAKDDVIKNMQRFAALGLPVYVTEFDVNLNAIHQSNDYRNKLQAQIASNMVRACIESKVCRSFGELGVADQRNWFDFFGRSKTHAHLFDSNYQPKSAFYSYRSAWTQP
jgi:endo-1,4-beta-xylanase